MIDTREPVQGSLFDGPRRDAAIARVVGRAHPPLAAAEAARRAVLAHHKARNREWIHRATVAMRALYAERKAAAVASSTLVYVAAHDCTAWAKAAGFDGDPRALSVFTDRKAWRKVGTVLNPRRNATATPAWAPVEEAP